MSTAPDAVDPARAALARASSASLGVVAMALHRLARAVGHAARRRCRGTWPGCSTSTRPSPPWRSTGPAAWPLAGSLLYLWPRTRSLFWDRLAAAAVEVGAVFSALTLVTGSLWGRPAWGVWWTWDARLTSTALLLLLEIGYLALRRVPADPAVRARRCAVAAILVAIDVPIVHFSVDWWNTLHQSGTVLDPGFQPCTSHGSMAWTMLLGFVAFSLIFVWLLGVRYRIEVLQDEVGDQELEVSLAERWSEDTELVGVGERARAGPGRGRTMSYVDAGYAIALGDAVRLRRRPGPAPPALGAGAQGVGAAVEERAGRSAGERP